MVIGSVLVAIGCSAVSLFSAALPLIFGLAVLYNIGQQLRLVPSSPFLTEHSQPEQRNELFALHSPCSTRRRSSSALVGSALAGPVRGVERRGRRTAPRHTGC